MTKTLANIRIYGDDLSMVNVAPKGTTLPADLTTPLVAAFKDIGWLSEDGVDIERKLNTTKHKAFQGGSVVRQKRVSDGDTFTFTALEETATALGLYYTGSTVTSATGTSTIAVPASVNTDERAWVIDVVDGAVTTRYTVARGEVIDMDKVGHKNTEMTMYKFTVGIIGAFSIITNNPAFP
jgi:hypothetical protein